MQKGAACARQLPAPSALRAATSFYRAAFSSGGIAANRLRAGVPLGIPILALGSEGGVGDNIVMHFELSQQT